MTMTTKTMMAGKADQAQARLLIKRENLHVRFSRTTLCNAQIDPVRVLDLKIRIASSKRGLNTREAKLTTYREHLTRVHLEKPGWFRCLRCQEEFDNRESLGHHLQQEKSCERKPLQFRIDEECEDRLKSMARNYSGAEAEKWRDIYEVLFGGEQPIPSPCECIFEDISVDQCITEHLQTMMTSSERHLLF